MKIVVQNFETGKLSLSEAPEPRVKSGGILVRTSASLISVGTDRAVIGLAKKSMLAKAKDRPDLARQVIDKARTDGLWTTYKVVKNLLKEPIPLGYSLVGTVLQVGTDVHGVMPGDRVACVGLGFANHAETVFVPKNLFTPVPPTVDDESAAYVALGAIAMHGIRQADQQLGATVLVVGLGLVGQVTVQLCAAAGYRVIGLDFDERKLALARDCGASLVLSPTDPMLVAGVAAFTHGHGVDAALITTASKDNGEVFTQVAALCRDRARVVVVGEAKMDMTRRDYFNKELEILQARSYGPGRYDANYEEKGEDYPIGYVRWTERRNMQSFLELAAAGHINLSRLTTHRFPIEQAEQAYRDVMESNGPMMVGVLLTYDSAKEAVPAPAVTKAAKLGTLGLGIIGTGRFARGILLPALLDTNAFQTIGVSSGGGLSAELVRQKYGAAYATTDASRVLDDPSVQAVVIATRPDSHARFAIQALERDKHVFVEKPLCLNREELAAVKEAEEKSRATLTVGFNRRFSPLILKMRDHFAGRQEPMAMMYRVNAGRIPLAAKEGWVHEAKIGGGRIISEACHFIDTMQFLCGSAHIVRVTAFAANPAQKTLASDDIASILIAFADGSIGTVHYWANGTRRFAKERVEVFCQERVAILDNFRRLELISDRRARTHRTMEQQKGFAEEARAFVESCRTGIPAIPLESLMNTTLATFLATEDLHG